MPSKREVKNTEIKLEIQSYEYESEMYLREKEKCEFFLKNVKAKCESKMREYFKIKYK